MKKKTFGQTYIDFKGKLADKIDVREQFKAKSEEFYSQLTESLERGAAQFSGDFFISVLIKQEQLFDDMFHFYFIPRESAPYPTTNTILFHFNHKKEDLDVWWALPKMEKCAWFMTSEAFSVLDKDLHGTYLMVKDFYDGILDKKVTNYNDLITKSNLRPGFNPKDYDKGQLVVQS